MTISLMLLHLASVILHYPNGTLSMYTAGTFLGINGRSSHILSPCGANLARSNVNSPQQHPTPLDFTQPCAVDMSDSSFHYLDTS